MKSRVIMSLLRSKSKLVRLLIHKHSTMKFPQALLMFAVIGLRKLVQQE